MTPVLVIAAFAMTWLADGAALPPAWPWLAVVTAAAVPLVGGAVLLGVTSVLVRRLDRTGDGRIVGIIHSAVNGYLLLSLAGHAAALFVFGWLETVRAAVGDRPGVDELLSLAPLAVALTLGLLARYPVERRIREATVLRRLDAGKPVHAPPGPIRSVIGGWRHQALIFVLPLAVLGVWGEWTREAASSLGDWAAAALQLAGAAVIFAVSPLMLRLAWDTVALGPGPLRERLLTMCRRHGVGLSGVLVWRTGGAIVNAAVAGMLRRPRYIILSDALLEELEPAEVDAVAAHEIAHVARRHLPWLAASVLVSVAVVGTPLGWLAAVMPAPGVLSIVAAGLTLAAALVVLGFVSRRFEWQADAFAACEAAARRGSPLVEREDALAMVSALRAVASLSGLPRHRFMWRHGSIAERQRRLVGLIGSPVDAVPIDRLVRRLKRMLVLIGGLAAALTGADIALVTLL